MDIVQKLEQQLEFPRKIRMHWTGCPNSCGQVRTDALQWQPSRRHALWLQGALCRLAASRTGLCLHLSGSLVRCSCMACSPGSASPHCEQAPHLQPIGYLRAVSPKAAPRCKWPTSGSWAAQPSSTARRWRACASSLGGTIGENRQVLAEQFEKGIACEESVLLPKLRQLLIENFGATQKAGVPEPAYA